MHLHRGFGDADIVGNLFAQAGRAPLEWELVEVDDALRPPAGASKVHESFWMPHCRGNRGSRAGQPAELIAGPIMDAVMRQIGAGGI